MPRLLFLHFPDKIKGKSPAADGATLNTLTGESGIMATTIKEIARLAGVSIGTVDRALHNRGRVDPAVAQRIQNIAQELAYKPNSIAQGLSARSRRLRVAVVFHRKNLDPYFQDVLQGIEICRGEAAEASVEVDLLYGEDFSVESQLELLGQVEREQYNALIVVPINDEAVIARINALCQGGMPVILLTNLIEGCDFLSFIGCDYTLSGEIAAGLLNMIHPMPGKLLYLSPSFHMLGHVLRLNGLRQQLSRFYPQIELCSVCELTGNDRWDYQITKDALHQNPDTDMVVCPGAAGRGHMEALEEFARGRKIRIVSYDDSHSTEQYIRDRFITATLVQHPVQQGYLAVKTAVNRLLDPRNFTAEKFQYLPTGVYFLENLSNIHSRYRI